MPRTGSPPSADTAGPAATAPVAGGSRTIRKGFSRSRKGCLTCRRYHLKCPETGESCSKCIESARECVWPDNVIKEREAMASNGGASMITVAAAARPGVPNPVPPPLQIVSSSSSQSTLPPTALSLIRPLEPCLLAYPDPTQRHLMQLFVSSASKLILNISLQPSKISFLDLSRLVSSPEPGFSGDALRFSLLGIGALHDAWARGHSDQSVLEVALSVSRAMTDASAACLTATVALGGARGGGGGRVEETALAAAAMLSYSQVLAGVHGQRTALDVAYELVRNGGGFETLLANAKAKPEMRKVLEFIAVFDVLDSLGTQREPHFLGSGSEASWWPRDRSEVPYQELDSVETTFGVSRELIRLFAQVVRLVARSTNRDLYTQAQPTDMLYIHPALFEIGDPRDHSISDIGLVVEATSLEGELDRWEGSADAALTLPRACQGNKIYILTAKILLWTLVRGVPRTANEVQAASVTIMGLLVECHSRFDGVLYFMWPLLIAGSQLDVDLRSLPLNVLDIFSATYLFDCTAALRTLQITWERMDRGHPNASIQSVVHELGHQFL